MIKPKEKGRSASGAAYRAADPVHPADPVHRPARPAALNIIRPHLLGQSPSPTARPCVVVHDGAQGRRIGAHDGHVSEVHITDKSGAHGFLGRTFRRPRSRRRSAEPSSASRWPVNSRCARVEPESQVFTSPSCRSGTSDLPDDPDAARTDQPRGDHRAEIAGHRDALGAGSRTRFDLLQTAVWRDPCSLPLAAISRWARPMPGRAQ